MYITSTQKKSFAVYLNYKTLLKCVENLKTICWLKVKIFMTMLECLLDIIIK